jgi:hypothetical protein
MWTRTKKHSLLKRLHGTARSVGASLESVRWIPIVRSSCAVKVRLLHSRAICDFVSSAVVVLVRGSKRCRHEGRSLMNSGLIRQYTRSTKPRLRDRAWLLQTQCFSYAFRLVHAMSSFTSCARSAGACRHQVPTAFGFSRGLATAVLDLRLALT